MEKISHPSRCIGQNMTSWLYNGLDSAVTLEIYQKLIKDTNQTYEENLAKQVCALAMEMRGIKIDLAKRSIFKNYLETTIKRVQKNFDKLCLKTVGHIVNPTSPKQVKDLMYRSLELPQQRSKNVRGEYVATTGQAALEKLQTHFYARPYISHILTLRDLRKQLSFINTKLDPDGRFRASFNVVGTNTGRWSSSFSDTGTGQNLQNVDRRMRSIFCADKGYLFLNVDLEQADSRNLGARCYTLFHQEREDASKYLDACESGDLHTQVAKMVFTKLAWGTASDKEIALAMFTPTDSYRQVAKKLGHASNYMGSAKVVSVATRVDISTVKTFQEGYFNAYPTIPLWWDWVISQVKEEGQLTTLGGRTRQFFGRREDPKVHKEAIAFEPQSLTAHEIDMGLLQIWNKWPEVQPLMQGHDNILFQIPTSYEDRIGRILEDMKYTIELPGGRPFFVPLEAKVGKNWSDSEGLRVWKDT